MKEFNAKEAIKKLQILKEMSGTHSPSIATIKSEVLPLDHIKVDACFLSNPYATELYLNKLERRFEEQPSLFRELLEFYPPQNKDIAQSLARNLNIDSFNIFIGNGAIEIIQMVMHRIVKERVALPIPTFSSYYEFKLENTDVSFFQLSEVHGFRMDLREYSEFIEENDCTDAIVINPNNPNGFYNSSDEILEFVDRHKDLNSIIIDESFVHFAFEEDSLTLQELGGELLKYPNVIVIKSMSKDFGIAGIRAGYALMSKERVSKFLENGFLWNSSGLSADFFEMYSDKVFQKEYEIVRKKYIMNVLLFNSEIAQISGLKPFPTKANFVLLKILNGKSSWQVMTELLVNYGVYVRDCSDKIGLEGEFIRVACRSFEENQVIIRALKEVCDY